ncbi:hypothetical protein ACHAXR_012582 [Thalassiosira sp. AJA248-18]
MEDRHTVSDPRSVGIGGDGNLPSWEVDILRDDTVIVDTFLLNNDVLPPRTNKKGKVVWRLPDKGEKLVSSIRQPSFGTDDRRRILDIFKDRKKKRKQEKKKRNLSPSQEDGDPAGKCERRDSNSTSPGEKKSDGRGGGSGNGICERSDSGNKPPGEKGRIGSGGAKSKTKLKGKANGRLSSENLSKERDGNASTEIGNGKRQIKNNVQVERGRESNRDSFNEHDRPPKPLPPGLGSSPIKGHASTLPARGQRQSQPLSTQSHAHAPSTPDPSRMSLDDPIERSIPAQPQSAQESPVLSSQTPFIEPPPSDALFITVPRNERPQPLPGQPESSLAVPAARNFIGKYYSHFDGTLQGAQIGDLSCYYTSKAQKSVSIGGAHSVVTGRRDIAAQILNLAGAAFVVRGVVAQDTADGKGVHILVTGTARTSLNGSAGGVVASFAHSISLVPIDDGVLRKMYRSDDYKRGNGALREAFEVGFPFQIHNDALALLSGDAGPVAPTPIPQPVQMQQPPPPPGLF